MAARRSVHLGLDIGTSNVAAVAGDGEQLQLVPLDSHETIVPSAVHITADGARSFALAAQRRGGTDPAGLAVGFKRAFGDPVPLVLNGHSATAVELTRDLAEWASGQVRRFFDAALDSVVVTHPAHWQATERRLFAEAMTDAVASADVTLLDEPTAIALRHASRIDGEQIVAIYDFGGGTFDATVVRIDGDDHEILGTPIGVRDLGGIDLDDAVRTWTIEQIGRDRFAGLDRTDPGVQRSLRRLSAEVERAKQTLSSAPEAVVSVALGGVHDDLRLTVAEFESLIRPHVDATVDALRRALRAASLEPGDVDAVLLAGGSSRVPMVSETLTRQLGIPIVDSGHPKLAVALGAAATAVAGPGAAAATLTRLLPVVVAEEPLSQPQRDPSADAGASAATAAAPSTLAPEDASGGASDAGRAAAATVAGDPVEPSAAPPAVENPAVLDPAASAPAAGDVQPRPVDPAPTSAAPSTHPADGASAPVPPHQPDPAPTAPNPPVAPPPPSPQPDPAEHPAAPMVGSASVFGEAAVAGRGQDPTVPNPPVDGPPRGGPPGDRPPSPAGPAPTPKRRLGPLVGVGAVLAVAVVGGIVLLTDDDPAVEVAATTTTTTTTPSTVFIDTVAEVDEPAPIEYPVTCRVTDLAADGSLAAPLEGPCAPLTATGERLLDGETLLDPTSPGLSISRCATTTGATLWLRYVENDDELQPSNGWVQLDENTDLDLDPIGPPVQVQDRRGSTSDTQTVTADRVNDDVGELVFEITESADGIIATCYRDVSRQSDRDGVAFRWDPPGS